MAFGRERTIEQDSTFAFRVIVDRAIKALSPAINDPITAVIAIDQLQRLLRSVGRRDLRDEGMSDGQGKLRLIFHTPNWYDFVDLTFSEIRIYGAGNLLALLRASSQTGPPRGADFNDLPRAGPRGPLEPRHHRANCSEVQRDSVSVPGDFFASMVSDAWVA